MDGECNETEQATVGERKSLIKDVFSPLLLRKLWYHAARIDIADNNDKAQMVMELLGPEFDEIGTGTNRVAAMRNGIVYKIALDTRGEIDNFTEYKRSSELENFVIRVYETNMLINVCEYVTVFDQEQFEMNETTVKMILEQLAKGYIFEDLGFTLKNYYNWGYRDDKTIVALDFGYLYSNVGQDNALTCPHCKARLKYDANYVDFVCENPTCDVRFRPMDIRRRMVADLEKSEDKIITNLNKIHTPNFSEFETIE
jgi:hypothetical protein